jgi:protein SCO1
MAVSTRTYAVAAASTTLAALLGAFILSQKAAEDPFADCRTGAVAGGPATIGGPFTLTDEDGRVVTDKDVLGKPSLVYFGYSFCPDVCPTDLARNAGAVDILGQMGHEVTPVFISVDPGRDTPEVLKQWTDALHPQMVGLTGSADQIAAAAKAYRTIYRVPTDPQDQFYLVDHMTYTYLMIPGTGFAEFFQSADSADDVATRTACFIDHAG